MIFAFLITSDGLSCLDFSIKTLANDNTGIFEYNELPIVGGSGGSKTSGDNQITSSTFEYASMNYNSKETSFRFFYSDDFFKEGASNLSK